MTKTTPFFSDLCSLLAHLAFYPLAYFTLFPDVRLDLLGIDQSSVADGLLWFFLCGCGYAVMKAKRATNVGPLARFGAITFNLIICILTPFMIGFAILAIVSFAGGGFEGLFIWWKGLFFFGFLWAYFSSD